MLNQCFKYINRQTTKQTNWNFITNLQKIVEVQQGYVGDHVTKAVIGLIAIN